MGHSKSGKTRPTPPKDRMEAAVNDVLQKKLTIRQSAEKYGVSKSSIGWYIKQCQGSGNASFLYTPKYNIHLVFSDEEEEELSNYLLQSAKLHYGLTKVETRKLAYQFAKRNNKDESAMNPMMEVPLPVIPEINTNNVDSQQTPHPSMSSKIGRITPEVIRPFSKPAGERKSKDVKRKQLGKTRILTETPQKMEIEAKKRKSVTEKRVSKKKPTPVRRLYESSSEENADEVLELSDSTDSDCDIEEALARELEQQFDFESLSEGDFLLVQCTGDRVKNILIFC